MRSVAFSPQASDDLEAIGDHIAIENPRAAIRFVTALRERCMRITEAPNIGRERPDLASSLRSIAFRRYVILYTIEAQEIRIQRVVHGARDIEAIFADED